MALAPAREALWYFFGVRLLTTSRPLANGARASTRTHPITAHRKCHRSRPSRVAWHIPPLLPNEKDARGSIKKLGELLTALSLCVEARELFLQICRDPATQARTRGGLSKQTLTREGCTKSQGNSRRPSHSVQRLGALPATLPRPSDLGSHPNGLGKQPLRPNKKDV